MKELLKFTNDWVFFTVQGEGRYVGVPSIFIRLSYCNLRCQWVEKSGRVITCDTPYSSFTPDMNSKSIEETLEEVKKHPCKNVVITGGEPFLQKDVLTLIGRLEELGYHITVETNATIYLESKAHFFSLSPKLRSSVPHNSPHASMHEKNRINLEAISRFIAFDHQLKFVVHDEGDITEIEAILLRLKHEFHYQDESHVYLMPQGSSVSLLNEKSLWIIEVCKRKGWKFADRMHIRVWGDKRGV